MQAIQKLWMQSQIMSEHGCELKIIKLSPKEFTQRLCDKSNAEQGTLHLEDGYECDLCKNKGYIHIVTEYRGNYLETRKPCQCERIRKAIRRLNRSGLKNVVKNCTFERYIAETDWQTTAKSAAIRFCKDEHRGWFFMGGQSGSGKSHLCTAITVHFIKKGYEAKYMLWRDEIAKIKASVNDAPVYAAMMKELKEAPVLYIDDLFKSGKGEDGNYKPPTAADVNAAFEIINFRYNNPELITIISSERTLSELNQIDEAIAGRIAEKTKVGGYCLNIKRDPARNWRMKGIQEL